MNDGCYDQIARTLQVLINSSDCKARNAGVFVNADVHASQASLLVLITPGLAWLISTL